MSVRVHPVRGVTVTVPYLVPYSAGIRFLLSKKKWVLSVMARQKAAFGTAAPVSPEQTETLRCEAREYLPRRLAALASRYGFEYNRLAIKDNRSNWGSCSSKNNINLNLRLMLVPEHLRDYVMLHELCHLRYHDHGPAFHALLERLCADWFAGSCPVPPVHPGPSIHPFPSARLSKRNSGHIIRHDLFCSRLLFDAFCFHPSVCSCFLYFYFLNLLAVNDRHVRTAFIIGPIAMESFFNDSRGMSVQQCRLSAKDRQTPPPESSPEAFSYISWTRNFMYSTRH